MQYTQNKLIYDVIFVGASLESLNVLTRLPDTILKNSIVVDSCGSWLWDFRRWARNLLIDFIRTPLNVHPSPKPLALRYYVDKQKRTDELLEMEGSAPLPSADLYCDFCDSLIQKLPVNIQQIRQDTVVDVHRVHQDSNVMTEVSLASGKVLYCRCLVLGFSGVRPIIPKWILKFNLEKDPRIKTVDDLEFQSCPEGSMGNKNIAILGGGMSAGTIVLRALESGAKHVYLISRRHLCRQNFECNPGWSGMKYLNAYQQLDDNQAKLAMCNKARDRGSVLPAMWDRLVQMQAEGRLNVIEGVEVDQFNGDKQIHLALTRNSQIKRNDLSSLDHQLNNTPFSRDVRSLLSRKSGDGKGIMKVGSMKSLSCDEVWIACGYAFSVQQHSILSKLMEKYPIDVIGGYPTLASGCSWPGVAAFVPGRGSMLTVGPCAGSMIGMKLSAELISSSIQKTLSKTFEQKQEGTTDDHEQKTEARFDPVNRVEIWQMDGNHTWVEPTFKHNHFPLESENQINRCCEEQVAIKATYRNIDVQDLGKGTEKLEIQSFVFIDSGFKISVIIELDESISRDSVRVRVTRTSLEIWLICEEKAYHLNIPKLYGKVVPERTKVRIKENKNKLTLTLCKEKDSEWKFLKG